MMLLCVILKFITGNDAAETFSMKQKIFFYFE